MLAKAASVLALTSMPGCCEGVFFALYNQAQTSSQNQYVNARPVIRVRSSYHKIYFAAGLSDRLEAIDLIADLLAYCPAASSMRFIFTASAGPATGRTGDMYTVLSEGVYLGFLPRPFDENPRLATRKYEIAAWDRDSVENLKFSVESRRAQAKI